MLTFPLNIEHWIWWSRALVVPHPSCSGSFTHPLLSLFPPHLGTLPLLYLNKPYICSELFLCSGDIHLAVGWYSGPYSGGTLNVLFSTFMTPNDGSTTSRAQGSALPFLKFWYVCINHSHCCICSFSSVYVLLCYT